MLVSVLGGDFEAELRRIYDRARTLDEVTAELRALRDKVAEERKRFEEAHARTADLIEKRLDEGIQRRVPPAQGTRTRRPRRARSRPARGRDQLPRCQRASLMSAKRVGEEELLRVAPSPLLPEDLREGSHRGDRPVEGAPAAVPRPSSGPGGGDCSRATCRHGWPRS